MSGQSLLPMQQRTEFIIISVIPILKSHTTNDCNACDSIFWCFCRSPWTSNLKNEAARMFFLFFFFKCTGNKKIMWTEPHSGCSTSLRDTSASRFFSRRFDVTNIYNHSLMRGLGAGSDSHWLLHGERTSTSVSYVGMWLQAQSATVCRLPGENGGTSILLHLISAFYLPLGV